MIKSILYLKLSKPLSLEVQSKGLFPVFYNIKPKKY